MKGQSVIIQAFPKTGYNLFGTWIFSFQKTEHSRMLMIDHFLCQSASHFLEINRIGRKSIPGVQVTDGNFLPRELLDICRTVPTDGFPDHAVGPFLTDCGDMFQFRLQVGLAVKQEHVVSVLLSSFKNPVEQQRGEIRTAKKHCQKERFSVGKILDSTVGCIIVFFHDLQNTASGFRMDVLVLVIYDL